MCNLVWGGRIYVSFDSEFLIKENILIVRLSGELDHHEAKQLREKWQTVLFENDVHHVIVNFSEVTFMDSSGLGVILGRYKEVLQLGGKLVICSVNQSIKRLFEMSGILKIVQLEENEQFALHALGVAS